MANNFDMGMFGNTPTIDRNKQYADSYIPISNGLSFAGGALQQAQTMALRHDPFEDLTKAVKERQRKSAVQAAYLQGLTPQSGDSFYSFVRDNLASVGDIEGADLVENKRLSSKSQDIENSYKEAATKGINADTAEKNTKLFLGIPGRTMDDQERRTGIMQGQLSMEGRKQDWVEDTYQSPEEKWKYISKQLNLQHDLTLERMRENNRAAEERTRITAGATIARANATAGARSAKNKQITAKDIDLATKNFLGYYYKSKEGGDPGGFSTIQRWEEEFGGTSIEEIATQAGSDEPKISAPATAKLNRIGMEIASNYKDLQEKFPDSPQMQLWDIATEAPIGARIYVHPKTKEAYYGIPDSSAPGGMLWVKPVKDK